MTIRGSQLENNCTQVYKLITSVNVEGISNAMALFSCPAEQIY